MAVTGNVNSSLESSGVIDFTSINGIDPCTSFSTYTGVSCTPLTGDKIGVEVPLELVIDNIGGNSSFIIDLILTKGTNNYTTIKFDDGGVKTDTYTLNQVGDGQTTKNIKLYIEMYPKGINALNSFSSIINVELKIQ